jgi:hypothetical protein
MISEPYFKALEIFNNNQKGIDRDTFLRITKDVEYHEYFIETDEGVSPSVAFDYLITYDLIKQGKPLLDFRYDITTKGKNVYGNEFKKRLAQEKRDGLQTTLNESALRTNIFIALTFLATAVASVFMGLNYSLDKSKEREPILLKQIDSVTQRLRIVRDSLNNIKSYDRSTKKDTTAGN